MPRPLPSPTAVTHWAQLPPGDIETAIAWAERLPWAMAMAACAQDRDWHAEGDVWTHTRLVCRELPGVPGWHDLDDKGRAACVMAAVFHDAGKPKTTRSDPASGRMCAPKHAVAGAALARRELSKLGCPPRLREEIVALVRNHAVPPRVLEHVDPVRQVIRLSWLLDTRALGILARADFRGRICRPPRAHGEEGFHLWDLVCKEHDCDGRPFPFGNEHARFLYFRDPEFDRTRVPHESPRCTVTIVCGLPAAGKDTWLAARRPELPAVSLDALRARLDASPADDQGRVSQAAREECRRHLRAGRDFAFNATNISERVRGRWVNLFVAYDARIEMVYVDASLATALSRNRRRARPVPEVVIRRLHDRLEPPTLLECHTLHVVDEGDAP